MIRKKITKNIEKDLKKNNHMKTDIINEQEKNPIDSLKLNKFIDSLKIDDQSKLIDIKTREICLKCKRKRKFKTII